MWMRAVIAWRLVKNSALYSRKTVIALALIVALIISMGGIVSGLGQYASDIILRAGSTPYLIIYESGESLGTSLVPNKTLEVLDHPSIRLIQSCRYFQAEQVVKLNSSLMLGQELSTTQSSPLPTLNFPLIATDVPKYLSFRNTSEILIGSHPTLLDETNLGNHTFGGNNYNGTFVIPALIPSSFLSYMKDVNVGDILRVNFSGVYRPVNVHFDVAETEEKSVYDSSVLLNVTGIYKSSSLRDEAILIDFFTLLQVAPELGSDYSYVEILVDDPAASIEVKLAIQNNLRKQQINAVIEEEQQSLTLLRLIMNEILEKLLMFVIFLYLVAGFRLLTSQLWILVLYQRELRILRILGASPLYLASIFFIMGSLFFVLGFALGVVLGVALPLILTFIFQVSSSFPLINYHPNVSDVVFLFVSGYVVVIITTILLLPKFYDKNLIVSTTEIDL